MRIALLLLSALLSSCTLYDRLGNKPYLFPTEAEPSAEVTVNFNERSWFDIFNMDANGCFAGTSTLGSSGSSVKIHADTETFMALNRRHGNSFCQVIFSFSPESNARYRFTQGTHVENAPGILGVLSGPAFYCTVTGEKILPSGKTEALTLKKMNLRPSGFACLRMREIAQ